MHLLEVYMSCGKCGCGKKGGRLCPVSFGLAIGLTVGLAVFIWSVWVMYNGLPPMMAQYQIPLPTWTTSITDALWGLLKGFVFGFVVALIYDLIGRCCKCKACKRGDVQCGCSCCSNPNNKFVKPESTKQF
jgi:hypothetical protein